MNLAAYADQPQIVAGRPTVLTEVANGQRVRMQQSDSFKFRHSLAQSPVLTLAEITGITKRLLDANRFDQIFYRSGSGEHGLRYSNAENANDVLETLRSLEGPSLGWLRLTRVDEVDDRLADISEQFYEDLSALYQQDMKASTFKTFVTLFVSAPGAVTPYHFDHTLNFLLQICGTKTVYLFDPRDPAVLSQQDRENWYMNRLRKLERIDAKAIPYDLTPGTGVHHPVNAPHWVQNGTELSVSLSLGLCLHVSNRDAKIHQMNFMLRKLGLHPPAPRKNSLKDAWKVGFLEWISDRNPSTFDDVLFSGIRRMKRVLMPWARRSRDAYQE